MTPTEATSTARAAMADQSLIGSPIVKVVKTK